MTCPDYTPGDRHGKTMMICKYYLDGACSKPNRFMCEEWVKAYERKQGE